ncbi:hypothetical protein JMJ77_0009395 [Colletotrichum scovillei]|uniref:Transmembrane protein n=1 Tax=Colletotrichum scovillei TaxID=1209932 RepID=A0A9P7UEQ8_9PEZI|nr:hypothetical protein JMJ77_0009395 [Colletotrichum scovillei]KAG7052474.1 hypothetical protein JMJ78_0005490 [Colletotrichum scovillei]KAG7064764.1 hypothetical protein JMJ76_0012522 [Colletotrichum scovillei]
MLHVRLRLTACPRLFDVGVYGVLKGVFNEFSNDYNRTIGWSHALMAPVVRLRRWFSPLPRETEPDSATRGRRFSNHLSCVTAMPTARQNAVRKASPLAFAKVRGFVVLHLFCHDHGQFTLPIVEWHPSYSRGAVQKQDGAIGEGFSSFPGLFYTQLLCSGRHRADLAAANRQWNSQYPYGVLRPSSAIFAASAQQLSGCQSTDNNVAAAERRTPMDIRQERGRVQGFSPPIFCPPNLTFTFFIAGNVVASMLVIGLTLRHLAVAYFPQHLLRRPLFYTHGPYFLVR